jgi:DNA-directed RNA polymerase specialized sigma subunit
MAAKLKSHGAVNEIAARVMTGKEFVNNEEFKLKLKEYNDNRKQLLSEGKPIPQVTEYLGRCFMMIAESLSRKPYFIGYSFRDEMVSDALMDCIKYIDKFDAERGTSAFAYFSQICYFAIVRRIKKENNQTKIKSEIVQNLGSLFDEIALQEVDDGNQYHNSLAEILKVQNIKYEDGNLKPVEVEPDDVVIPQQKSVFFDDEVDNE